MRKNVNSRWRDALKFSIINDLIRQDCTSQYVACDVIAKDWLAFVFGNNLLFLFE